MNMATGSTPVKSVVKDVQEDKYCRVCGEFVITHSGYFNIFSEKSKERHLAEFLSKVLESEVSISTGSHFICVAGSSSKVERKSSDEHTEVALRKPLLNSSKTLLKIAE